MRQKLSLLSFSAPSVKTAVFSVLWMALVAIQLTGMPASHALTSITNLAVSDSGADLREVSSAPSATEAPTSLVAVAATPT